MSNSVFVKFCLMSSVASNRRPFRTFLSLGNRKKSHGVRLVSMVTAATERCRVWPKTAAQGVKCVYGNIVVVQDPVTIPPFFWSFSANWFTQTSQDRQAEFLVNYLPIGSILVVYDTLRINHFLVSRCWRSSRGGGDALNGGSTLFKLTEPVKHLCMTHCIFTVCLLQ